jgi:hypothetical protein
MAAVLLWSTAAVAQSSAWQVQRSDDGTVVASVGVDYPGGQGVTILGLLNVGFGTRDGCQPEIAVALLKGAHYGSAVGRISPPRTEPMSLVIDGMSVATPAPYLVKYDNGLEVLFPGDQRTVDALASGSTAVVQIVPGSPRLMFPIAGASDDMEEAQRECQAAR